MSNRKDAFIKEIRAAVRANKELGKTPEQTIVIARAVNNEMAAKFPMADLPSDIDLLVINNDEHGLPSPIVFAKPEEAAQTVPYPITIFDGTLPGEFAERCTKGNHIAKELFVESFFTTLGAVLGNQLRGDQKGMFPRQYTIAVAP